MRLVHLVLCSATLVDVLALVFSANRTKQKVFYVFPTKPLTTALPPPPPPQRKERLLANKTQAAKKYDSPEAEAYVVDADANSYAEVVYPENSVDHQHQHHEYQATEPPTHFYHHYKHKNKHKKHPSKQFGNFPSFGSFGDIDGDGDDDQTGLIDFGDDEEEDDVVTVVGKKGHYKAPAFLQLRRILRFVGRILYFKIFLKMAILSFAMLFLPKMNLYHMFHAFSGYEKDAQKEEDYDQLLNEDDDDDDEDDDDDGEGANVSFNPDFNFDNDFNFDFTGGGDDDDSDNDSDDDSDEDSDDDRSAARRVVKGNRNGVRRVKRRRQGNNRRRIVVVGKNRTAVVYTRGKRRRRKPKRKVVRVVG